MDYLLTAKRDRKAAKRFLSRAVRSNDKPVKINIDKSGANTAGIQVHKMRAKALISKSVRINI
ncbi:DDE-type integrase/transposase/recombinase [Oligoflexus sp.]|uniref:DDE-type integrase/transposase/recombinase n=1 Tax=Oligoflexus sp. TaxID=1971216 RepID=UPI0039C94A10